MFDVSSWDTNSYVRNILAANVHDLDGYGDSLNSFIIKSTKQI